ncbi:unnamed protein product [Cochlearia groenlandica]
MHIPLLGEVENQTFMDIPYLAKQLVIVGECGEKYGYSFKVGDVQRIVLLPNQDCTSFDCHDAIHFEPGWDHFHDVTREPLTYVRGPRKTTRTAGLRMRE